MKKVLDCAPKVRSGLDGGGGISPTDDLALAFTRAQPVPLRLPLAFALPADNYMEL